MTPFFILPFLCVLQALPTASATSPIACPSNISNIELAFPMCVFVDDAGDIYIADAHNHRICKIDHSSGQISIIAGSSKGFFGDGGRATAAKIHSPDTVMVDVWGNVYIADTMNSRIRLIDKTTGHINTVAGNGRQTYRGDGGIATNASLHYPTSLFVDPLGNIYIADTYNHCIRFVDHQTHIISTIAGKGKPGFNGDGIQAASAKLNYPTCVRVDLQGNVYIADQGNHRIRKVDQATQKISTVAGNGKAGFSGDGRSADCAQINLAFGLCLDKSGNIYISDSNNNCIRMVDHTTQKISTIVQSGILHFDDKEYECTLNLNYPTGVFVDSLGIIYIVNAANDCIHIVDPLTKCISTIGLMENNPPLQKKP